MRLPKKGIQYGMGIGYFPLLLSRNAILDFTEVMRNVDTNRRPTAAATPVAFSWACARHQKGEEIPSGSTAQASSCFYVSRKALKSDGA